MAITPGGRRREPLHVVPMALALVLAAFTGAALGLIWQSTAIASEEGEIAAEDPRLTAAPKGE